MARLLGDDEFREEAMQSPGAGQAVHAGGSHAATRAALLRHSSAFREKPDLMGSPAPRRTDLAIVAALGLISLVLVTLPTAPGLEACAGVLLTLILPGYVIAAAVFPPGDLRVGVRGALVVAFSIACSALGGLGLQFLLPLNHTTFAVLLLGGRQRASSSRPGDGRGSSRARQHSPPGPRPDGLHDPRAGPRAGSSPAPRS